jgi:CHRD domain
MIRIRRLTTTLAVLAAAAAAPAFGGNFTFPTTLSGYNETPQTLNSPATGQFLAKISKDETSIDYTLTYSGFPATDTVTQAHIHFGRPSLGGGVVLFLCTNGTPPAGVPVPPPCPLTGGTVTGTLTAANVIAVAAQGIDADGAGFAEMIKAMRNGAAYANVHTVGHPSGEIRGPLGKAGDDENDDD